MTEMLKIFGLKLEGKHHSGIDDTYNIARVAQELVKRGINFAPKLVAKV
jgi:inhibitor of KinA sporulation pathway (predicted exonuclease)